MAPGRRKGQINEITAKSSYRQHIRQTEINTTAICRSGAATGQQRTLSDMGIDSATIKDTVGRGIVSHRSPQ